MPCVTTPNPRSASVNAESNRALGVTLAAASIGGPVGSKDPSLIRGDQSFQYRALLSKVRVKTLRARARDARNIGRGVLCLM